MQEHDVFVLLAIRFLQIGWRVIQGKQEGFGLADEAKEALRELKEEQEKAAAEESSETEEGSEE